MATKETYYFSHDYNARTDIKIKKLITRHKMLGYGVYWALVEDLYNNGNRIPCDYSDIAAELRVSESVATSVIKDFQLFEITDNFFSSLSVEKRLNARAEKVEKAKESARKRWEKYDGNANGMRTHSDGNAINNKKGKDKKGNNSNNVLTDIKAASPEKPSTSLESSFTLEQTASFEKFRLWISADAPNVAKMKNPFTIEQYLKLAKDYKADVIKDLIMKMDNWADLNKKNLYAYKTFLNWAGRDYKPPVKEAATSADDKFKTLLLNGK